MSCPEMPSDHLAAPATFHADEMFPMDRRIGAAGARSTPVSGGRKAIIRVLK
jgi:hypothetical protein